MSSEKVNKLTNKLISREIKLLAKLQKLLTNYDHDEDVKFTEHDYNDAIESQLATEPVPVPVEVIPKKEVDPKNYFLLSLRWHLLHLLNPNQKRCLNIFFI